MPSSSIAEQVDTFNEGFTEQIGPQLAAVFDTEQADLRAAGLPDTVVRVGDRLPDADLLTPTGDTTTLQATLGDGPAVLVFYRGAWCPYCNLTLRTYQQELLPELDALGARLVAVSPQTPEGSEAAIANGELAFPVRSDPGNALAAQLGIVTEPSPEARRAHTQLGFDVADSNADETAAVPFPSVFVVDADRVVRFADVQVDYTARTEVVTIVEAVRALTA
jgi:peroxiredoxin